MPQIIQQAPPLTYHLQQTSPGMIVFDVSFEVFRQAVDTLCQKRNLNLGRACVSRVRLVLTDHFGLSFFSQSHC